MEDNNDNGKKPPAGEDPAVIEEKKELRKIMLAPWPAENTEAFWAFRKKWEEAGERYAQLCGVKGENGERVIFFDFGGEEPDGVFISIKTTLGPGDPPNVIPKEACKINYPLDKANAKIWSLAQKGERPITGDINTGKAGDKQKSIVEFGINFDSVSLTKELNAFDKRCYISVAALFNAGNEIITATQIYHEMGNTDKPSAEWIKKINDSLTKMGSTRIYIDNEKEVEATKKHKHFKYDASLLPFERITASVGGRLTESAIHLFREPPLISFSKERLQFTTIPKRLFDVPASKTEGNLRIEDYLIQRIAHMKTPGQKAFRKILFSTLFQECGISEKKQKQRTPEKIWKCLEHLKKEGWIRDFKTDSDGVIITLPKDKTKTKEGGPKIEGEAAKIEQDEPKKV